MKRRRRKRKTKRRRRFAWAELVRSSCSEVCVYVGHELLGVKRAQTAPIFARVLVPLVESLLRGHERLGGCYPPAFSSRSGPRSSVSGTCQQSDWRRRWWAPERVSQQPESQLLYLSAGDRLPRHYYHRLSYPYSRPHYQNQVSWILWQKSPSS